MELWKVPQVPRVPWAFIALGFNVIPGTGTMMAGARSGVQEHWVLGFLQFALFVLGVGMTLVVAPLALLALAAFVWSLVWGVLIVVKAQ